jgi:rubrerythrin
MKVIDFAIEVERSEQEFFRRMANQSDREELKALFARRAEEEGLSLQKFEEIKTRGPENEDSPVLDALLTRIRKELESEQVLRARDEVDIYRRLAETEKVVCRLVREAAEGETDEKAAWRLAQVAGKECRQSEELETIFDFVNAPNEYLAWGEFSNLDEFHNFGRYEGMMQILPERDRSH